MVALADFTLLLASVFRSFLVLFWTPSTQLGNLTWLHISGWHFAHAQSMPIALNHHRKQKKKLISNWYFVSSARARWMCVLLHGNSIRTGNFVGWVLCGCVRDDIRYTQQQQQQRPPCGDNEENSNNLINHLKICSRSLWSQSNGTKIRA